MKWSTLKVLKYALNTPTCSLLLCLHFHFLSEEPSLLPQLRSVPWFFSWARIQPRTRLWLFGSQGVSWSSYKPSTGMPSLSLSSCFGQPLFSPKWYHCLLCIEQLQLFLQLKTGLFARKGARSNAQAEKRGLQWGTKEVKLWQFPGRGFWGSFNPLSRLLNCWFSQLL